MKEGQAKQQQRPDTHVIAAPNVCKGVRKEREKRKEGRGNILY
jgi:hypothetical protein